MSIFGWRWRHFLAIGVAAGWLVAAAVPASAFTLITPVAKLYVTPAAGYTTSFVQVRGTLVVQNVCPPPPTTFKFLFDGKALWTRAVNTCNPTTYTWDTGRSPYIKPPSPPTVGNHTILLNVYVSTNGTTPIATAKYLYAVYRAPASPSPKTSPSPQAVASPSPSPSQCAVTGALPPAGTGGFVDNFIAASMLAAVLPIVGLALFSPRRILQAAGRRRRILLLFGLGVMTFMTLSCTSSVATPSGQSPVAAVSPSAQPSPSPSC